MVRINIMSRKDITFDKMAKKLIKYEKDSRERF